MPGWHMGSSRDLFHTLSMMIATRERTASRTENDRISRLVEAYRERGDRRAIEQILAAHGKLLNHLAGRYAASSGEPYEDLLQVAHLGLIKAVNGYRGESGASFGSYAYAIIDGELRHYFRDSELVRKPRWARGLYAKVKEANLRLTAELGRPPLVEEISQEVNVTPEGVIELMKLFLDTNVASLDVGEEGVNLAAIRSLQHESFALPIEDRIQLQQSLESLSEVQRKVVHLFFYEDLSQTEIGSLLGLSQRKVSRLVASAIKSLRSLHGAESGECPN
jgi:RNA polymerase sigma-B factor